MKVNPVMSANNQQNYQSPSNTSLHFKEILAHVTSNTVSDDDKKESLQNVYNDWRGSFLSTGISADRRDNILGYADQYMSVMNKAIDQGGYIDPLGFVSSLSDEELQALQYTQALAEPINPADLSEEGALNLLLPPSHSQDINNDGFQETGIARGWDFPPRNAPMSVHNAWQQSMEGLSPKDRMLATGMFIGTMLEGNLKPDGSGIYEPGEAGYNNPFASDDYSYKNLVEQMLESNEAFKAQSSIEQYERNKVFLTNILSAFSEHGVA